MIAEHLLDFLDALARCAVDDPALARKLADDPKRFSGPVRRMTNFVEEIFSVKSGHDGKRIVQPEKFGHVLANDFRRRCRKRTDDRPLRQRSDKGGDIEVGRTKILSPFRYAVRFVDSDIINDGICSKTLK